MYEPTRESEKELMQWILTALCVLWIGSALAAPSPAPPKPWSAVPPIGVEATWSHPARPGHLLSLVRENTQSEVSFKNVKDEDLASGLIATRKLTLEQLGFKDWRAKRFHHAHKDGSDVILLSGNYTRPDGKPIQFLEMMRFKGRRFVQITYAVESAKASDLGADAESLVRGLLEGAQ